MGTNAYANGRSIACKAANGKSVCAFPDVCWSPPSPTAGPITLPYPNTGMASDIRGGSKSVKVAGKEAALKDASCFSKSTGDEAATKTLGMGVVTHQIRGKVYFKSWSMDVKIEGKNATRMMDLTTHNHASETGNTPPWPYVDKAATRAVKRDCKADIQKEQEACKDCTPYGDKDPCGPKPPKYHDALNAARKIKKADRTPAQQAAYDKEMGVYQTKRRAYERRLAKRNKKDPCLKKRRCMLVPYEPKSGQRACCEGQTAHHLVEAASFLEPGTRGDTNTPRNPSWKYDPGQAPCVCAEGASWHTATHGLLHTHQGVRAQKISAKNDGKWKMSQAAETGAASVGMVFRESGCSQACIQAQIRSAHKKMGVEPTDEIAAVPSYKENQGAIDAAKRRWKRYDAKKRRAKQLLAGESDR